MRRWGGTLLRWWLVVGSCRSDCEGALVAVVVSDARDGGPLVGGKWYAVIVVKV
jgi:hypothetical protein